MENIHEEMYTRVGYAFVPVQSFEKMYPPEEALSNGTAFPELNLPMSVYGPKPN
ncbi:MAG: spore coat associated protein CotJA [Ruminococcaceae bacterium]|nr:spore coat associated protein CotJA [Oscillospiraceae bacterium]